MANLLIVTNTERFPKQWQSATGEKGEGVYARSASDFIRYVHRPDTILLVNCDPALAFQVAARTLLRSRAADLMSVDLVLRKPLDLKNRLSLPPKRLLLRRFDHHIHYFRDFRGLEQVFGMDPRRCSFVPFKPNLRYRYALESDRPGDYVLCFGRSMRDYDTFFDAMDLLPYPGAIPAPDYGELRVHGARFTRSLSALPKNVRVLDDDGTDEALIRIILDARLFVVPVLKASIVASGISTSLNAMLMGKCVIGSDGPGMTDVFSREILSFEPENAAALADVIRQAWENDRLRRTTAQAGLQYAQSLGGESDLYQRILDEAVRLHAAVNATR
jgi:glycosyltransferase involved in cell wall biosynthesis